MENKYNRVARIYLVPGTINGIVDIANFPDGERSPEKFIKKGQVNFYSHLTHEQLMMAYTGKYGSNAQVGVSPIQSHASFLSDELDFHIHAVIHEFGGRPIKDSPLETSEE